MAAFLEGKLAPGEVAAVAVHLRECADCRTVTGQAARFERQEEERRFGARTGRGPRSRWWIAPAAAAAAAVAVLVARPEPGIATLIDASPREYRRVEGRLSGFPWARHQGGQRSTTPSQAELKLNSAAYGVLDRTADDQAVDARHAAGVAHLLIDQRTASLDKLDSAAGESKDAAIWNDLAVARFAVAAGGGRAEQYPLALAAVKRALELDPTLLEAHFNQALILEHLDRDQAREAWARYLELDPSSEWSVEARKRLQDLGEPASRLDIRKELERAAGRRDEIASLVRRAPQDARTAGEGSLMADWAQATLANDAARAEKTLAVLRAVGEELAAASGERLLHDAVRAIERAPDRGAVAAVFATYADARLAYSPRARDLQRAEEGFRRAAAGFRAAQNPFAGLADYYAAQCAYDRNRPAESTAALHALRARLDPAHYALAGEIDLILARNASSAAEWGAALRSAERASATFAALGETEKRATAAAYEAIALERMGNRDLAWQRRLQSLGLLRDRTRAASILHSGALALAAADLAPAADAILDIAGYESSAELRATIFTDRARLAERAGDLVAARRWLGEARTQLGGLNPDLREAREAQIDLAEAMLRRASNPHQAIAALGRSIEFFESRNTGIRLPDAYLQRARAYRAIGRNDAALADYHAALRKVDEQQENAGRTSLEFLDVAAQIIDETVDLHLRRGEAGQAFTVLDRAHAMAASGYRTAAVPDGTAVLEYAMLPDSLVIFCLTSRGLAAERVNIGRAALAARVTSFVRKLQARQDVREDAASLHALLIAPMASQIAGARELVIVPDRELNELPFRALHDGKRYLIQAYPVRVAPSAAAAPPAAGRHASAGAVVIGDPATERASRLQWSRSEAKSIAAIHGAAILEGSAATRARVTEAIASSAIVHYAGHADSNIASYGALMLAPSGEDSDLLTASDIARLQLRARPLVVLSACGTLRGDTSHVAGTPSLARAFVSAGASAVVGTLWEIDDDVAPELFLRFHERLRAGEVPAGALRAAQLEMLQSSDPRMRHPSSWSAVEVLSNL